MNRRSFLQVTGLAALASLIGIEAAQHDEPFIMQENWNNPPTYRVIDYPGIPIGSMSYEQGYIWVKVNQDKWVQLG